MARARCWLTANNIISIFIVGVMLVLTFASCISAVNLYAGVWNSVFFFVNCFLFYLILILFFCLWLKPFLRDHSVCFFLASSFVVFVLWTLTLFHFVLGFVRRKSEKIELFKRRNVMQKQRNRHALCERACSENKEYTNCIAKIHKIYEHHVPKINNRMHISTFQHHQYHKSLEHDDVVLAVLQYVEEQTIYTHLSWNTLCLRLGAFFSFIHPFVH